MLNIPINYNKRTLKQQKFTMANGFNYTLPAIKSTLVCLRVKSVVYK